MGVGLVFLLSSEVMKQEKGDGGGLLSTWVVLSVV
jgi:hypothetical protein